MLSASAVQPHSSLRSRRYKTALACTTCRRRKVKCDGLRPACGRCQNKRELRETCTYIRTPARRNSTVNHLPSLVAASPDLTPDTSAPTHSNNFGGIGTSSHDAAGDPGEFMFEVKSTVDSRLGLPAPKKRCPILLTDAPLFGSFSLPEVIDGAENPAINVLPPRRQADRLVNLYWQCLNPLEPLLDQGSFCAAYQALFDGRDLGCNEQTFLCLLNLVFTLSTQLQESSPSEQRNNASRTFFLRAWHLLHPGMIIWQDGSLEKVLCLVLMARYLQCTPNLQQTWMALGSAVRIALSIGLDRLEKNGENQLAQDIWVQCVFMDRSMSWALGRPSTVPVVPCILFPSLQTGRNLPTTDDWTSAPLPQKMQELAKITSHIGPCRVLVSASETPGLITPTQSELSDVMQIDDCLIALENSLPPVSSNATSDGIADFFDPRLLLLRLRLAHARIMLLRPMMARFCLSRLQMQKGPTYAEKGLVDRVIETCATICVENAQKLIMLIQECSRPERSELLPWWYRVFYLYIAGQHLVTAMLRPDVFGSVVLEPWNTMVSVLRAHEHLSLSVRRCLNSFQMMWQRVNATHYEPTHETSPCRGEQEMSFQQVIDHLGFDVQLPLFGLEDSAMLENMDWIT